MARRCSYCGSAAHTVRHCPKHADAGKYAAAKKKHSAKWDRCVEDVKRAGTAVNAYAVCTGALGADAYHKGRSKNPLPRSGPIELTAVWTGRDGQEHTVFQRFPSVEKARTAARRLVIALNRVTPHPTRYNIRRRVPFNP